MRIRGLVGPLVEEKRQVPRVGRAVYSQSLSPMAVASRSPSDPARAARNKAAMFLSRCQSGGLSRTRAGVSPLFLRATGGGSRGGTEVERGENGTGAAAETVPTGERPDVLLPHEVVPPRHPAPDLRPRLEAVVVHRRAHPGPPRLPALPRRHGSPAGSIPSPSPRPGRSTPGGQVRRGVSAPHSAPSPPGWSRRSACVVLRCPGASTTAMSGSGSGVMDRGVPPRHTIHFENSRADWDARLTAAVCWPRLALCCAALSRRRSRCQGQGRV